MAFNIAHFTHPYWLWIGILIPLVWIFYFFFYQSIAPAHRLEKFIDKHLLPYLLVVSEKKEKNIWLSLVLWSLCWTFFTIAVAGPRWNYREVDSFSTDQSIVLLLDLSESMNATDSKPSRLSVAKQKIEDILRIGKGVKIGLLTFAADPHMIAPITDDHKMIQSILPSLTTELVFIQGSRLSPALLMASNMLATEPGENKSIAVLSDGGFEDAGAIKVAKELAQKGISIYTFGVGTLEGTLLQPKSKSDGKYISPIVTKLEKERLSEISKIGNGRYLESHYSDDEELLINDVRQKSNPQLHPAQKKQIWDEYFYLFLIPILPIFLWWFRKGCVIACCYFLFSSSSGSCGVYEDYFMTQEDWGKKAYDEGSFEEASTALQDPYRKGVAFYRCGNYSEAEKHFLASARPEVALETLYNLGNAYALQNQFEKAISAYEKVLAARADHLHAKENLEIVKKLLEQQKNESEKKDNEKNDKKDNDKKDNDKKDNEKKDRDSKNKEEQQKNEQANEDNQNQKNEESSQNSDEQESDKETSDQQENDQDEKDGDCENGEDTKNKNESQSAVEEKSASEKERDQKTDFWLNQIASDPKEFLKNKFYIESKKNKTLEGVDPW